MYAVIDGYPGEIFCNIYDTLEKAKIKAKELSEECDCPDDVSALSYTDLKNMNKCNARYFIVIAELGQVWNFVIENTCNLKLISGNSKAKSNTKKEKK
jgi:hypothetical protein